MKRSRTLRNCRNVRGLTLVELMVSMTIGLIIVIALSAVFVGSSNSRREVDSSADAIESGRYALDLLGRELTQTGFYGALVAPTGSTIAPCSATITDWRDSLAVHAVGFNNAEAGPSCLSRKAGTDAMFIQRASTCAIGEAGCEAASSDTALLQVSECGDEYSLTPVVVDWGNQTTFTLRTKACIASAAAERRKLVRRFYYVSSTDVLSYIEMSKTGAGAPVALVDNVEQLQFSYAFDTNNDGSPECFGATLAACPGATWPNVIGARVWVLARSANSSRNAAPAQTYVLDDTQVDIAAANTNLKRRVYTSYIPFVTPKARREQ
jgi:type IV pilus assembly protein PilW